MLLIFDLDGTLFQAKPVVLYAAENFCKERKKPLPEERYLYKNADTFINAVLPDCTDYESVRRQYDEILHGSVRHCGKLYPNVREMLSTLTLGGHTLLVLSASGLEYIKTVLEHTGIINFFKSFHSSRGGKKSAIINSLVPKGTKAAVIGDTHADIEAAQECLLISIAAMYGYGNKEMLKTADFFADSPPGIIRCVQSCEQLV